jgi:hypothetical protein
MGLHFTLGHDARRLWITKVDEGPDQAEGGIELDRFPRKGIPGKAAE